MPGLQSGAIYVVYAPWTRSDLTVLVVLWGSGRSPTDVAVSPPEPRGRRRRPELRGRRLRPPEPRGRRRRPAGAPRTYRSNNVKIWICSIVTLTMYVCMYIKLKRYGLKQVQCFGNFFPSSCSCPSPHPDRSLFPREELVLWLKIFIVLTIGVFCFQMK